MVISIVGVATDTTISFIINNKRPASAGFYLKEIRMGISQREKMYRDIRRTIAEAEKFNMESVPVIRQMTEKDRKELEWMRSHESCHKLKVRI